MVAKIAVLGGSGNAGSEIVKELAARGSYEVVAVARSTEKIPKEKNVTPVKADALNEDELVKAVKGSDVVISALHFNVKQPYLFAALKKAGVKRAIIVGGAASLTVSPDGPRLIDTKDFPEQFRPIALQGIDYLTTLKTEKEVDWTFVSPPLFIEPGPKTGKYRSGTTVLLVDEQGNSKISFADYAVGLVDELESHKHAYAQITFAY